MLMHINKFNMNKEFMTKYNRLDVREEDKNNKLIQNSLKESNTPLWEKTLNKIYRSVDLIVRAINSLIKNNSHFFTEKQEHTANIEQIIEKEEIIEVLLNSKTGEITRKELANYKTPKKTPKKINYDKGKKQTINVVNIKKI